MLTRRKSLCPCLWTPSIQAIRAKTLRDRSDHRALGRCTSGKAARHDADPRRVSRAFREYEPL